ncbi:MAG: response regulator transcription factor [Caldilineaceae bacterium]
MSIRLFLADDHKVLRAGLRALLETYPDLTVSGEAGNGLEAVRAVIKLRPDVAILDIAMPELNGIEAARQIRSECPQTQAIILSMHSSHQHIYQALKAGVRGYILKEAAPDELVDAIRTVHAGQRYLSPKVADELIEDYIDAHPRRMTDTALDLLSERERTVLQLVVEGKSSIEIAELLMLSPKTVDSYRSRLMQKLGITDLPGLVKFAIQQGLISLE